MYILFVTFFNLFTVGPCFNLFFLGNCALCFVQGLVLSIVEMLPNCEHRACARHVYANWAKKFRGVDYKFHFWAIAKSTNMEMYNIHCHELRDIDEEAYNDLMNRNPSKW